MSVISDLTKEAIKEYQQKLATEGFYKGAPDGIPGTLTMAAYQASLISKTPPAPAPIGVPQSSPVGTPRHSGNLRVCPGPVTTKGADASGYQGPIDFPSMLAGGVAWCYVKMCEGITLNDAWGKNHWTTSRAAGVIRQPYTFFHELEDPVAQAQKLVDAVNAAGGFLSGDLPPIVDNEWSDGLKEMNAQAADNLLIMLQTLEKLVPWGLPWIYTASGFFINVPNPERFYKYPCIIANYGVACPEVPAPWNRWTAWQPSGDAYVPGVNGKCDTDIFDGSLAQLKAMAKP